MSLNKFIWNNYKTTEQGNKVIAVFENGCSENLLGKFFSDDECAYLLSAIEEWDSFWETPVLPSELTIHEAENLFNEIVDKGYSIKCDNAEFSTWLYYKYPTFFKPYYFVGKFQL